MGGGGTAHKFISNNDVQIYLFIIETNYVFIVNRDYNETCPEFQ